MTILVTLTADLECGEGDVKLRTVFDELDGLTRADVLKDWIGELEVLYNDALRDWAVETEPYRTGSLVQTPWGFATLNVKEKVNG